MDLVIGAASGMGSAVARRLAARGHGLILADRDVEGAERVASALGGRVQVRGCDVRRRADLEALAEATGAFDALVLTAGLSPTMAAGRQIFEVDIVGPGHLLEVFEPLAGPGAVAVVLASMAGHLAPDAETVDRVLDDPLSPRFFEDLVDVGIDVDDPNVAYMLSKRALQRLVRHRCKAWGDRGARLLSLSPGIVDTPMGRRENDALPVMADMVSASALGRMIDPDEVAAVIEFLVSPAAAALTGVDVLVDGGAVAQLTG